MMEAYLIYILKASAILASFFLLWRFSLYGKTLHRESRLYLLSASVLSFILPFVVITVTRTVELASGEALSGAPVAMETVQTGTQGFTVGWMSVFLVLYLVGAAMVACYNLVSLIKVTKIIRGSSAAVLEDGTHVMVSPVLSVPFSFFGTIVVPSREMPSPRESLVLHEKAHVRYGHSWDIQLCAAICTLQWFNPFAWMLRKDLRAIHEFQADGAVLDRGIRARDYQLFLVEELLSSGGLALANNLTKSNLKNRIEMMSKKTTAKGALAWLLLSLPIATVCLAANSKTVVTYSDPDEIVAPQNDETVPFQMVEVKPGFNGGDANEFSKWVAENMVYPKEAVEKNIQGRVTVQFTVGKDGSVYGVRILRGVHELLDAEAVRVVSASPKWTPGKQKGEPVSVTYTFPVKFQTGPSSTENVSSQSAPADGDSVPFQMIDEKPTFNGGDANEFAKWVNENLVYPKEAYEAKIQGRVTLSYVIGEDGSVSDVRVLRGANELLDAEAVRVVSMSPKWTPGKRDGKPVKVTFTFPVIFQLR